jgi:hypothetical protein
MIARPPLPGVPNGFLFSGWDTGLAYTTEYPIPLLTRSAAHAASINHNEPGKSNGN